MFSLSLVLSALAFSSLVQGDVLPTEPGPGTVFKQGQTCRTVWTGDTDGKWSNMAIELMTGSDLQMVHLTTLKEGLDGNKDGQLEFNCPEVDPYSAIYFFQYSAPGATGFQWATRFTIADKDGKSVPPPEDTQPSGKKIGWGIGKLVDGTSATPPPSFQTQGGNGTGSTNSSTTVSTTTADDTTSSTASKTTSGSTVKSTTTPIGTGTGSGSSGGSSGGSGSGSNSNSTGNGNTANGSKNGTTNGNNQNGAVAVAFSNVPWLAAIAFSATALFI